MSFSPKCLAVAIDRMPREDYVQYISRIIENGAALIGGCSGTNPDCIRQMAVIIKQ